MNYIEQVTKRYNAARNNEIPWFDKFVRWYGLYRGQQTRKNYQGRSNLFIPAAFWTVESFVPKIVRSFRKIIATPQEPGDVPNSKATTTLLEYQKKEIGFEETLRKWVRSTGIYGSYPVKVTWDYQAGYKDSPCVDLVDIADFFFDPNADTMEQARWVIHKTQRHIDDLKNDPKYKNVDQITPAGNSKKDDWLKQQRKSLIFVSQNNDKSNGMVDIFEYWGYIPTSDDPKNPQEKNMLITVANKNTVIREEVNPMADILPGCALPFVMMYDLDVPHEMYGIGEIEPIESLQEELNDTRNQRMDNVTLVMNPVVEVLRAANIEEESFLALPGKYYYSNIPNGIRFIPPADVTASAYNEEKFIKEDIQQTAIGSSSVDVAAVSKSDTATGIMAIQEAGDVRTEYKVQNMKIAVQKVWRMILALDQKLIDKEFVIRLEGANGTEFQTLKPADIKGNYDVDIEVESQQNRLMKKQEAMQLYQLAQNTPNANIPKRYKALLDLFDVQNVEDELLPPPPPTPPVPAVSVSLRGELTQNETDSLAQTFGASPASSDPMNRADVRLNEKARQGFKEPLLPDEQKVLNEILNSAPKIDGQATP